MQRFRRLRRSKTIRSLVRETWLRAEDLIQPFFVIEGKNKKETIPSMPDIFRFSGDLLVDAISRYIDAGGRAGLFFGVNSDPKKKDSHGHNAYDTTGVIQKAVASIKKKFPDFLIITDVCLCAYTNHGHCGIVKGKEILNDETLSLLSKVAVSHAEAGSDIVAPSDMMDFRVKAIREALDKNHFSNTAILSYAVKYASAFYGPFREAAHSKPSFGDRKTYQMDFANQREALKEAKQDVQEGADMVMVKPALAYLDIIQLLKARLDIPVVSYQVSGEYSLIKAAAQKKWVDEKSIVLETLTAIKRAGSDIIISYYAEDALRWLSQNR